MIDESRFMRAVQTIQHEDVLQVVLYLRQFKCEVVVPNVIYRIGENEYSLRELTARCLGQVLRACGKPFFSAHLIELGIVYYQNLVGVTPVTLEAKRRLCNPADVDSERALALAMEVGRWAWFAVPEHRRHEAEQHIEEAAHIVLRWIENCKRRILGIDPEMRQIAPHFWGTGGTFKSTIARHLVAPLGDVADVINNIEKTLSGFDGARLAQNIVLLWDEMAGHSVKIIPSLKEVITGHSFRADVKGKEPVTIPVLTSFFFTSNPGPLELFPDPAMLRRVGAVRFQFPIPAVDRERWVVQNIQPFDAELLWKSVNPEKRASSEYVLERNRARYVHKDILELFLEDHVRRVPDTSRKVLMSELFTHFRTLATEGNWQIRHWTNLRMADKMRDLGYDVRRTSRGTAVFGVELSDDPIMLQLVGEEAS